MKANENNLTANDIFLFAFVALAIWLVVTSQ
jgi:hypothetical protein